MDHFQPFAEAYSGRCVRNLRRRLSILRQRRSVGVSPSTGYSPQTHVVGNGASGIARSRCGRRRWLGDKQSFKSVAKPTSHKAINSKVNGICSNDEHELSTGKNQARNPLRRGMISRLKVVSTHRNAMKNPWGRLTTRNILTMMTSIMLVELLSV